MAKKKRIKRTGPVPRTKYEIVYDEARVFYTASTGITVECLPAARAIEAARASVPDPIHQCQEQQPAQQPHDSKVSRHPWYKGSNRTLLGPRHQPPIPSRYRFRG